MKRVGFPLPFFFVGGTSCRDGFGFFAHSKPKPSRGKHAPTKKTLPVGATSCRDGFGFFAHSIPKPSRGKHAPTKKHLPVGATSCRDGLYLLIQTKLI